MATRNAKPVRLLERAAIGKSASVDRESGIIRGVKLLGPESANGRQYTESARRNATKLYEGAKVNVNHRKGSGDRDYRDRIGVIRNVESRNDGLFGDLHYNPKHALAEQLAWDAEHSPENVGLSHDAEGRTRNERGKVLVEEITRVHSVDLVSDPATVRGLFESEENMDPELDAPAPVEGGGSSIQQMILDGVAKILDGDGEPKAKAAAIKTLVEKLLKVEADVDAAINGEPAEPAAAEGDTETPESKRRSESNLQEQVRVLLAEKNARKMLAEAKVEATEALVESLALLPTDAARKSLIESLPRLCATTNGRPLPQPRSSTPFTESRDEIKQPESLDDFVKLFR